MSEKNNKVLKIGLAIGLVILGIAVLIILIPIDKKNREIREFGESFYNESLNDSRLRYMIDNKDDYSESVINMAQRALRFDDDALREKYINFSYNYPFHKDDYHSMTYTQDELNSESVAALYMSDPRWAYETIGRNFIFQDGCMAVAITMAGLNLTRDKSIDPVKVARNAEELNGVFLDGGISSHYVKPVCEAQGLNVTEYNYDESDGGSGEADLKLIKDIIDSGHVIIAGMVGETFGGHAIIIRECTDDGMIYINDPANKENTEKAWSFDNLKSEIYFIWDLSAGK